MASTATAVEEHNPAARWRVDPSFAGPSYVLGDVGTHPLYISEVILPHLKIKRLMCARQSFVKSRAPLEDNAVTLMEYDNGAIGTVWSSAVNAGSMHGQKVRIVGSKASLEWWDERPNQLSYEVQGQPARVLERGMGYLHPGGPGRGPDRRRAIRKGLFEAWANLYSRFALAMDATDRGDDGGSRRCAIRTSRPGSKACAGSRTASARPMPAGSGSTIGKNVAIRSGIAPDVAVHFSSIRRCAKPLERAFDPSAHLPGRRPCTGPGPAKARTKRSFDPGDLSEHPDSGDGSKRRNT